MPSAFTHTPAEVEHHKPGFGGRPPFDHRPTGGGGGGGDDGSNDELGGPRALLYRVRTYLFLVLAADLTVLFTLVWILLSRLQSAPLQPPGQTVEGRPIVLHLPWILYVNSFLLMLGTVTIERARQQIFNEIDVLEEWLGLGRPALKRTRPWLAAALVLGLGFAGGQALGWSMMTARLLAQPGLQHTATASLFFSSVGVHGAHLGLTLLLLSACLLGLGRLRRVELRQVVVDALAWSWHALSLVWLLLLLVLAAYV